MDLNHAQLFGGIRHVLTGAGAIGTYKGYVDENTVIELVSMAMTVLNFVWFWRSKKNVRYSK